jgi:hypothetical protein
MGKIGFVQDLLSSRGLAPEGIKRQKRDAIMFDDLFLLSF